MWTLTVSIRQHNLSAGKRDTSLRINCVRSPSEMEKHCHVGYKVLVRLYEGQVVSGFVHSYSTQNGELTLEKVESIEDGVRRKLVGLQNFFADEIEKIDVLEDALKNKGKQALEGAAHKRGRSVVEQKRTPSHLSRMEFLEPSTLLLKNTKQDDLGSSGNEAGTSDSDQDNVPLSDEFTIINKIGELFFEAVKAIRRHMVVGVAMQGVCLGRKGKLSWVQIFDGGHTFLFDILRLGEHAFKEGLESILEDENILKVFHDCRIASDILHHQYSVDLVNVFDTQVADVFIYRLHHNNDWPRHTSNLASCLMTYLDLPMEDINTTVVRQHCREFDEKVWLQRPPQRHVVEAAVRNVKHLPSLRTELMDRMLEQYVAGVNIYLMQVRDSADSDALKYQSTMSHLLPTAFQHIQSFMRYRPVGMIRPVEKDKNGFQDNFPSPRIIVQPNVYFPHDSLWHARPRKAGKSSGTATEERSPTTSSKTQKASLSSNPPTNPVRTDTEALPPSVTSMSFHQRRVSQPSSSDSEPSARDPDGPIIASQRNLRQQDDAVHRALMEAGGVVSAREEVYNGEIMATSGRLSEDEVQPVWPQSLDVTDTPSQISGSLMRELVYQQDPKGYESTVSLDKFSLRPAGRTEEGQRKKKSGSSVSAETVSLGQGRGHMQSHMTDEIKSNIPGLRTYQGVSRVQQFLGLPIETNKDGFSGSNYHTGRDPHQQNGRGGEFPVHTPYDRPVHQTQIVDVGLVVGRKTLSIGESDMSAYQDDMLKADASLSDVVDRPRGRRSLPVQSQNGSRRQRLQEMLQQQST